MNEKNIEHLLINAYLLPDKRKYFEPILTSGIPVKNVFMNRHDLVTGLFPQLAQSVGFEHNSKYHRHDVYEHSLYVVDFCKTHKFTIKLAALLHDIGKPKAAFLGEDGYTHFHGHPQISYEICKEMLPETMKLGDDELDRVLELIKEHDKTLQADEKSVRRFIAKHGADFFEDWLVLRQADIDDHINIVTGAHRPDIAKIKQIYSKILEDDKKFKVSDLAVTGKDLLEIGIPQGKKIGETLSLLFKKVEKGCLPNLKNVLLDYCKAVERENEIDK